MLDMIGSLYVVSSSWVRSIADGFMGRVPRRREAGCRGTRTWSRAVVTGIAGNPNESVPAYSPGAAGATRKPVKGCGIQRATRHGARDTDDTGKVGAELAGVKGFCENYGRNEMEASRMSTENNGAPDRLDTRALIWQAMGEADIHRRYYIRRRDQLQTQNTICLAVSWVVGLVGVLVSIGVFGEIDVKWALTAVILAAAITSLRDVLGLPDRIAEARSVVIMTNDEYDEMRLLWETGGRHRPATELEAFRRISRASNIINEQIKPEILEEARKASVRYHEQVEAPDHRSILAPTGTAAGTSRTS